MTAVFQTRDGLMAFKEIELTDTGCFPPWIRLPCSPNEVYDKNIKEFETMRDIEVRIYELQTFSTNYFPFYQES